MVANPITVRPMTLADVSLGMRLKHIAGWNQRKADWRMLLKAGAGFVALYDGVPAGTVTVVTYQKHFSWIGMLLVDPAYRRRGVATALLQAAIKHAEPFGPVYLDATPQGRPLYERLGFRAVYSLVRMQRNGQLSVNSDQPSAVNGQLTAINDDVLADVARFDAAVFGANREVILRALRHNAPQYAYFVTQNAHLTGYCLGRSGSNYEQIGPVVAEGLAAARALLQTALRGCANHDVIVDVPIDQIAWKQCLNHTGFVERRPFTRMVLGEPAAVGQPEKYYAIAGPEMG